MSILTCKMIERDGLVVVLAPAVGVWIERPAPGTVVTAGQTIGLVNVLGRRHSIVLPAGAGGAIVGGRVSDKRRRLPIDYGAEILHLDPEAGGATLAAGPGQAGASGAALTFTSPSSGRFWRRPSPNDPPLCADGQEITRGQAIGLLEVMKTFTRLAYDGPGLPDKAIIKRVVPGDGDDVDAGSVLLELDPA